MKPRAPVISCGKRKRKEKHNEHFWVLQPEDDSPTVIEAFCPGYLVETP